MLKQELDTPALLVDLDRVERNIAEMAAFFHGHGVGWRPHTKGQKVPEIAHMEIEAGALGITCAKLGEAEVMAEAGVGDILIANQVVGRAEGGALGLALLDRADVVVAVDSIENGEELGAAAHARGKRLRVIVEVDNGMQRAGVAARGSRRVELARHVSPALPGLRFCGVMAWEAHCLGRPMEERRRCCEEAVGTLVATARQCREAGLDAENRELRRHRHVHDHRRNRGGHRDSGGRRDLQRRALRELGRRAPLRAHRDVHGDQPADPAAHHHRRRTQGDEHGHRDAAGDGPRSCREGGLERRARGRQPQRAE